MLAVWEYFFSTAAWVTSTSTGAAPATIVRRQLITETVVYDTTTIRL